MEGEEGVKQIEGKEGEASLLSWFGRTGPLR